MHIAYCTAAFYQEHAGRACADVSAHSQIVMRLHKCISTLAHFPCKILSMHAVAAGKHAFSQD